jgi:CRISPR/Cas system-associated exonuclease Cas4 (RecB family)
MPSQIINIETYENIIDFTADYIFRSNKKIALIGEGKETFLFLKKKLSEKYKTAFSPPSFFTNSKFVEDIIFENTEFVKISDIEAAFMIFEIVKNDVPQLLNGNCSFASFMDWAFEILSFIEQLDFENVSDEKLKTIKANSEIGYDLPESINNLLKGIFKIRNSFHNNLEKSSKITKGYSFLKAMLIDDYMLAEHFDEIILIAPFYLYKTELEIFKKLYNKGKLIIFIQGSPKEYEILKKLYFEFREPIIDDKKSKKEEYQLNVYSAFDDQSQGALLKNLISNYTEKKLDETVIIVPDSSMLQSIISEISIVTDRYNISIAYPADKTVIFSLLDAIVDAQISRKGCLYYSKDLMNILTNPLFKNMRFLENSSVYGIIAHKIERFLNRDSSSCLSGKIFISIEEIVNEKHLLSEISLSIAEVWKYLSQEKIIKILNEIFKIFFISWADIDSFYSLSNVLSVFLEKVSSLSAVSDYSLNVEAMEILLSLSKEMKSGEFSQLNFQNEEILSIFKKLIKNRKIALLNFGIKGLQILGLLESRNLSFDTVFIVGMKDSVIPTIKKDYSLIPKDIMYALGIEKSKKEYEIQRYHFNRLISGAKSLNFIYPDNDKDERSRFLESIIWKEQLENKNINAVKINQFVLPGLSMRYSCKKKYAKTREIKEYIKNMYYTYSKIDTYLSCRLKFYFRYVLLLDEKVKIGQELSGGDIGNFVHDFLKYALYENLSNVKLQSLEFEKEYFKKLENSFSNSQYFMFRDDSFMLKEILMYRMKNILYYEKQRVYKNIYACERKYGSNIKTELGNIYNLNCKIDRIDTDGKCYMIFDYKTGVNDNDIVKKKYLDLVFSNFSRQNIKKIVKSLQLPLYKYVFEKETGFTVSECGIYDIKKAKIHIFPIESEIYEKCIDVIKVLLDEINTGENFEFDVEDKVNCEICKYFFICR